ncbi:uncharacterized protein KD926_004948 [Aspergillus affinis]|uniref:uncharacterized protein n=1 Tax=Aspergillus affinis TaxID=1070780 RepID=UPI0022FF4012|nr:uncharacterized protein KD926_004948 [Aspergillus affinis]KAI9042882.1 hypothetical protein KD926_004948 [Aspergillus affinis]
MRWPARLASFFGALEPVLSQISGLSTVSKDTPPHMLFHQNEQNATVRVQVLCPGSADGYDSRLSLELNVGVAKVACGEQGIVLNGDDLIHNWNGSLGSGSGLITPLYGTAALTVNWQSRCVQPPAGSSEEDAIQHLTVRVERIGDVFIEGEVGLTASFKQVQRPEILRVYTSPWELSDSVSFVETWDSTEMADQSREEQSDESIERHWGHLLQLKTRYQQLALQIQEEERQIREMLQRDCPGTLSSWKNCRSFGCRFRISLTKFPDLIRQIRYRFGPFPPALPVSHCSQCPQQDGCEEASKSESGPTPTKQSNRPPQKAPHATSTSTIPSSAASKAIPSETEYFYNAQTIFTICVILVLASALLVFGFKLCRSTTYCRRRRVDRAARREERQARWAYGFAAHRLRWRQWWEGGSPSHTPLPAQAQLELTSPPNNNMSAIEQPPEQPHFSDTESYLPSEPGVMQAEIRGFRQALEYVGELVRSPDRREPRSSSRIDPSNSDHEIAELLGRRQGRPTTTAHTAASSTAGLSTVLSTGTSSLLTLDTPSSVTVDTLEASETTGPPPSYYA